MQVYTTLRRLRQASACKYRYAHLRKNLGKDYGDDTPIDIISILDINGLDDTLWVPISALTGENLKRRYRLFAVACCQNVLHLMDDTRSINAVKVAHLYAHGEASIEELAAARAAAWDAAVSAALDAAVDAALGSAWSAARAAARDAGRAAGRAAARDVRDTFRVIFSADY